MGTTGRLAHARAVRAHTAAVRVGAGWEPPQPSDVREVLLLLSASRGGSSLLYELLARHPQVVSLHGEHVPHYKLHGFDLDASEDGSDRFQRFRPADAAALGATISAGLRAAVPCGDTGHDLLFACDVADRLAVQWPEAGTEPARLLAAVLDAVEFHRKELPDGRWQLPGFLAALSRALAVACPGHPFRAHYTDSGEPRPEAEPALGPPAPRYTLEEPPFTMPGPRALPGPELLRRRVLLLKASVDAYRLPLVTALFPRARVRILHLTRNPAASVNGLMDGWLDRGFFSYNTRELADPVTLAIEGYSDRGPWGGSWWNFDAPPGWRALARAPLAEVAAFQWAGAHGAIIESLAGYPPSETLRVGFEDIAGAAARRQRTLRRILEFAGLDQSSGTAADQPLPLVMSTRTPRPGRWRERADAVLPALSDRHLMDVAGELGYSMVDREQWQ